VTGLKLTIQNIALDSLLGLALDGQSRAVRLPGLRGGHTTVTAGRVTLQRVEWFRGLRVSGFIDSKREVGRLTVSGPAAAAGTLLLDGEAVTGTIGGHPVRSADFD
jgi:hypothetical protein